MAQQNTADVVVVGAGPAGSNVAAVALRAGLSVIQVDRATFPRQKPCGGGLTGKSLRSLALPAGNSIRSRSAVVECNIWGDEINRFVYRKTVVSMIVRPEFDNFLVQQNKLLEKFSFFDGERVEGVSHDGHAFRVVTPKRVVIARQLVGADGANGIVNRAFRISNPRFAYAVEINPLYKTAEAAEYIPPCIDVGVHRQGYGWVFPKNDQWSVGLYTISRGVSQLKNLLAGYIRKKGIVINGDPLATFEAHPIPIAGYRLFVPNVLVYIVGDAGGFADAILGEGIFYALESGRLAGDTIVRVASGNASHTEYYAALRRRILPDTFLSYWLAKRLLYCEKRGNLWRMRKRIFQRLLVQSYADGYTITEAILRMGILLPKSFVESSFTIERDV